MSKRDCQMFVCAPFCRYYRPGEKEEMECRGAMVVEALLDAGLLDRDRLPATGTHPGLWQDRPAWLRDVLCRPCPFFEDGCDFQSSTPPPQAQPCGGYILLRLLYARGEVTCGDFTIPVKSTGWA